MRVFSYVKMSPWQYRNEMVEIVGEETKKSHISISWPNVR